MQPFSDWAAGAILIFLTAAGVAGLLGRWMTQRRGLNNPGWFNRRPRGTSWLQGQRAGFGRRVAGLLVTVALGLLAFVEARGAYYEVEVRGQTTSYRYRTTQVSSNGQTLEHTSLYKVITNSWSARCVFGGERWLIESGFVPNARDLHYHDGTNVYNLTELHAMPPAAAAAYGGRYGPGVPDIEEMTGAGWRFLSVTPGRVPMDHFGPTLIWLAFCSSTHLRQPGRLIPLGGEVRHTPDAFGYRDETRTFADPLGLPETVRFFADRKLLAKSPRHPALLRSTRHENELQVALAPRVTMSDGFLRACYQVTEATNIGGLHIPLRFVFESYIEGPGREPLLNGNRTGWVVSLRECDEPRSVVSPEYLLSVTDFRFRHPTKMADSIHYTLTNGVLPPTSDPRLRSLYKKEVAEAEYDPIFIKRIGVLGLAAVVLLPLLLGGCWAWQRQHRTKTTRKNAANENPKHQ